MKNSFIYHGGGCGKRTNFSNFQPFPDKVNVESIDTPEYLSDKLIQRTAIRLNVVTVSGIKKIDIYSDDFEGILASGLTQGNLESRGTNFINLGTMFTQTVIYSFAYCGSGIFLAGTGANGKVLRSTDYGITWSDLGTIVTGATTVPALQYLENGICLCGVGANGHILRSVDYGATWNDLGVMFAQKTIETITYCGNGIVVAGTNEGLTSGKKGHILRSVDYGATWNDLGTFNDEKRMKSSVYCGNGIVLFGTANTANLLKSTDYGATWTNKGQICTAYSLTDMTFCGGKIVLVSAINAVPTYNSRVLRTTDNGETWTDSGVIGTDQAIASIKYIGNGFALCQDGGSTIYRSNNYGLTWSLLFVADTGASLGGGIICGEKYTVLIGTGLSGKIYRTGIF